MACRRYSGLKTTGQVATSGQKNGAIGHLRGMKFQLSADAGQLCRKYFHPCVFVRFVNDFRFHGWGTQGGN